MGQILRRASVLELKNVSLTSLQRYTTVEADRLLEADPELTWPSIPDDVLAEMHSRVNGQLAKEGIPEVRYDVFSWRMARAIQYRTARKETANV